MNTVAGIRQFGGLKELAGFTSCEHDSEFYNFLKSRIPNNVEYLSREKRPDGNQALSVLESNKVYNIIVIDGKERIRCAHESINALTDEGIIIWDNPDRSSYLPGYDFLLARGFKRLDFWGIGPVCSYKWCTSIFYRRSNCLGI